MSELQDEESYTRVDYGVQYVDDKGLKLSFVFPTEALRDSFISILVDDKRATNITTHERDRTITYSPWRETGGRP